MSFPSVKSVCFHESGHAILARLAGLRVTRLTVHPDRGRLGHIAWESTRCPGPRRLILLHLGGPAAEELFDNGGFDLAALERRWRIWDVSDFRDARNCAEEIAGRCGDWRAVLDHAAEKVERLLCQPQTWAAVESVAGELLRCFSLQQQDFELLCQRADLFGPLAVQP
jgi:hypothetical protein